MEEEGSSTSITEKSLHTGGSEKADERSSSTSAEAPKSRRRAWGRALGQLNPALTLENNGSVARDHLASERTFLAYVRTSLGLASMGVALVQLLSTSADQSGTASAARKLGSVKPLGAATVAVGFVIMGIGITRYFRTQKALLDGRFPPARNVVMFMSCSLCVLVVIVFGVLVGVTR